MTQLVTWLARRACSLPKHNRTTPQATATTTAKAGRQHGGDQAQKQWSYAAVDGRQQRPCGGVIKSLCCTAAGINAFDLKAPAYLTYPKTGVRQARKLSTPLRSPTRLHAQLVVGYTRQLSSSWRCI